MNYLPEKSRIKFSTLAVIPDLINRKKGKVCHMP